MELLNLHNGQQLYSSSLAVGGLIGTATSGKNGLMSKDELFYIGNIGSNDMKNIGSSFGYSYGDSDGSKVTGAFLSLNVGPSIFQLKSGITGNKLVFRTWSYLTDSWSSWTEIQTIGIL